MTDQVSNYGNAVTTSLPGRAAENSQTAMRTTEYGEQYATLLQGGKMHPLAKEGSYFVATNATLGTAITGTAAPTAFSATVALLSVYNSSATKSLFIDYLRLFPKAAGTNGTNFLYAISVDRINRYASGGTAITPVNVNVSSDVSSSAVVYCGALVAAAAGPFVRRFSHGTLRTVIKVIGDVYEWRFGDSATPTPGMVLEGTAQAYIPVRCAPLVIPPGCSMLLHEAAASQSVAATYELELGYAER